MRSADVSCGNRVRGLVIISMWRYSYCSYQPSMLPLVLETERMCLLDFSILFFLDLIGFMCLEFNRSNNILGHLQGVFLMLLAMIEFKRTNILHQKASILVPSYCFLLNSLSRDLYNMGISKINVEFSFYNLSNLYCSLSLTWISFRLYLVSFVLYLILNMHSISWI